MKGKNPTLEKNIFNAIYPEFANYVLRDIYLSTFINSFEQLENLTNLQASFLAEMLKTDNLEQKTYEFANIHVGLKIDFLFLYEALNYMEELISKADLEIDYLKFKKVFSTLKDVSGKVYIKKMINESLESIVKEDNIENYLFIKEFESYINEEKIFESVYKCDIDDYIKSLEFKVKTFKNDDLRIKFEIAHNNIHKYANLFISFYAKKRYKEAVVILDELIKSSYLMFSFLKDIEFLWGKEKEKIFSSFLLESFKNEKGFIGIIIEPSVNKKIDEFVHKLYNDLKNGLKNFNNKFLFLSNDKIFIYFSRENEIEFKEELSLFKKIVTNIANKYKKQYSTILKYPIFRIGVLESFKTDIDEQIVMKIFDLIKEELNEVSTLEAVYFKDFTDVIEELVAEAKTLFEIENKTIEIIKNKNFTLFAQDIVDINTQKVKAIEILARVENIPAGKFIEFIKRNDLTIEMDLAVFNIVLQSLNLIKKRADRFFVNIFPTSLNSREFVELIKTISKKAKEMNLEMVMELTEYTILKNIEVLNELNVQIAFDDFGSGYTNYERIGKLIDNKNASIIKIDGEIVKNINKTGYKSILKSVSYYAKEENLEIVYEFVENEKIYNELKKIINEFGIKGYAQGYYFSKPTKIN